MSKNVLIDGVEYSGVSIVQMNTADGNVAQFKDIDEAVASGLNFVNKGTISRTAGTASSYWRATSTYDDLFTPAYEYGILLVEWLGTHAGADSAQGIQTQMFVYTPTGYRYIGHGYRGGTGAQMDSRLNGERTTDNLRSDDAVYGNGTMYTGYINSNCSGVTADEAELTEEQAAVFMQILSGCYAES